MYYIRDLKKKAKEIKSKEKHLEKLANEIDSLREQLQNTCHHPKQYIVEEKEYDCGDYYNVASTTVTPVCTLCEKEGNYTIKQHVNYG